MAIYFRFKSRKDFQSIAIPGKCICIGDLKDRIRKDRGLLRDYDLLVYNPQTGQEYDEFATIPSYTSVELRRIPGLPRPTLTDEPLEPPSTCAPQVGDSFTSNSSTITTTDPQEFDPHDFGEDVFAATKKKVDTKTNGLENGSSCSDCTNGTSGRGSSICGSFGQRGFARMTPPVGYICRRCNVPGHFIQHCPTNGDPSYDIRKQKPSTEIQPTPPANNLPPELHCPVCKALMKDAAFTKCCFRSLCDKCIRDYISAKSTCICGSMKMSMDDIIPNITLRELINRICESTATSREKSSSLVQAEDAGSANNEQAKVLSPTLPAVIKEGPNNFLGSNYGAMEVDVGATKGMFSGNGVHSLDKTIMKDTNPSEPTLEIKHKLVGGKKKMERTTKDYGTQNCGGRPLSSSDCSNFLGRRVLMGTDAYMAAASGDALLTGLVPQDPYSNPDFRSKRMKMSA